MAENFPDELSWLLEIEQGHLDYLGQIRHWDNLRIAAGRGVYWVKDFTQAQLDSLEVKSIPFKRIFYVKDQQLFPQGHLLPVKKLPSSLLWTPLERGVPVTLPSFNHNYFGVREKLSVRLIPSVTEQEASAMLIPLGMLRSYIGTAPGIRMKGLVWVIVEDAAFVLGVPMLPLPGAAYWRRGNSWLPAGHDFEYPVLSEVIYRELDAGNAGLLLWRQDSSFVVIGRDLLRPLSRSSVRGHTNAIIV
jgi:MoxR-vWA-beta-propeller ternary system protein